MKQQEHLNDTQPEQKVEQPKTPVKRVPRRAFFSGGLNYTDPNAHFPYGGVRGNGNVLVIDEKPGSKHPYRIKPVGGTEASGWVDKSTITF